MQNSQVTRRRFTQLCVAAALTAAAPPTKADAGTVPDPEIRKAMEAVRAAIPKAESDPSRPVYHFHPPANWNNDPNGPILYKGWYHMFYQHNPYASVWGTMHWGHARSKDLVNWEHLPIALWPSLDKGEVHCFSGGAALTDDGQVRLFYTSMGKRPPEQWMAIPLDDDLIVWEKYPQNPIMTPKIHGQQKVDSWRDPFLIREAGKTYMVAGGNLNGQKGGAGSVQLYEATSGDLTSWKYRGVLFEDRDREVINVECPNLLKLGSKWVLLISPHKPVQYFVGDLDFASGKFVPESRGMMDAGTSYAPNILYDKHPVSGDPRCIAWMWAPTATNPDRGWNGAHTMPRVITIGDDGFLRQNPVSEFESLRGSPQTIPPATIGDGKPFLLENISGDSIEIQASFTVDSTTKAVGLRVRRPISGGGTEIAFGPKDGMLAVAGTKTLVGAGKLIRLRIFLDKRVMEVFANDGTAASYAVTDANPQELGVEAFAVGGTARLDSLTAWPLKPASFSLDCYKI